MTRSSEYHIQKSEVSEFEQDSSRNIPEYHYFEHFNYQGLQLPHPIKSRLSLREFVTNQGSTIQEVVPESEPSDIEIQRTEALVSWLYEVMTELGEYQGMTIADHTYIVGGAVRDWMLGKASKDIDIVIDSVALQGYDSADLAQDLSQRIPAEVEVVTNQYGVAIMTVKEEWEVESDVDLNGEVIEIATARTESYGGGSGKGYKPSEVEAATIEQDTKRREFTFNTLLVPLSSLEEGFHPDTVVDPTGQGITDLENGYIQTPDDPNKTFQDDPTRMIRAIKFSQKYRDYDWQLAPETLQAIQNNAQALQEVPQHAVATLLMHTVLPYGTSAVEQLCQFNLDAPLQDIYQSDTAFKNTIDNWLRHQDCHYVIELCDAGLPFDYPWGVSHINADQLRETLLASSDPQALIQILRQPTKIFGDNRWMPDMAQQYGISKREMKDFAQEIKNQVTHIVSHHPELITSPEEVKQRVEKHLFDVYQRPGLEEDQTSQLQQVRSNLDMSKDTD